MFKKFWEFITNLFKKDKQGCCTLSNSTIDQKSNLNICFMNDPMYPEFILESEVPKNNFLPMAAQGEVSGYSNLGTVSQQAKALRQIINGMLLYLSSKSPKTIKGWTSGGVLNLVPRAGLDINAYYDRSSLKFFYFGDPKLKKRIYTCNSRPVVLHEFGHAFLDILRPDLWSSQALEIWAFHEAFGDLIGLFGLIEYNELIDLAVKQTQGNLLKSNVLSKMASEMGQGIYHITEGAYGESPDFLRDLANNFVYKEPETLPKEGREDQLLNQHHNFSRVFSGTFYELLISIANVKIKSGKDPKIALKEARDVCSAYLIEASCYAPSRVRMFESLCKQMLIIDKAAGEPYQKIMKRIFKKRKIIKTTVKVLSNKKRDEVVNSLSDPHEVFTFGNNSVVKTSSSKTIKISEKLGDVSALEKNPLYDLEIEVPNDCAYYFENDDLVEALETNESEILDSALNCLDFLNKKELVGNTEKSIFEIQDGKLIRKQFSCYCNLPNYCNPEAPEYQKPWKPKNNAGCFPCSQTQCDPLPCDCGTSNIVTPVSNGCYITYKKGVNAVYKIVNSCMKKSC